MGDLGEEHLKPDELPPKWINKSEKERSDYIKKLLDEFFESCTESIQAALLKRFNVPLEEIRDTKRKCEHYARDFEATMRQRSKYFLQIDFKDPKNLMKQLEYIWLKIENRLVLSPTIRVVILELFSAQKLYSTKKSRSHKVFSNQQDVNSALQKFYTELGDLTTICRVKLPNYSDQLGAHHSKAVSIKVQHEWCQDKCCNEETMSPYIQAVVHTIEKKLSELATSEGKTTSVQSILHGLTGELGNFQRMFEHPSVTVSWIKGADQSTWNEDPNKRRQNILEVLHQQSHRLKRLSGIHLIPPVYARCNGKLTKFTYKPGATASRPQFVYSTKISQNVHKATQHLHTAYNFMGKPTEVIQALADRNIIYVLLVIFPQSEVNKDSPQGYQVQAYVGSAPDGLMDAWFFRPGSHLQNAMDLMQYYKIHCKCSLDYHMNREGQHKHYPPRHPPPLIDCILLYARLKGYDTELYIVDKASGNVQSNTEAILQEKRSKWLHVLMANQQKWGLNTTPDYSCYVIDFRNENNPKTLMKTVESLWKQQMRFTAKDRMFETIKAAIGDIFGARNQPYVIDGITTVRNAIDSRIREIEKLQAMFLSETRRWKNIGCTDISILSSNVRMTWTKYHHTSEDIPPIIEAAITDIINLFNNSNNNKSKDQNDPNMALLKIHKQLVLFGALFEQKKLGIGWNDQPISTWDADPKIRRGKVLDALFWQRVSLKRMSTGSVKQVLDMLPPVYAKFGDGLARCTIKTTKPNRRQQHKLSQIYADHFDCTVFKGDNKHLQNIKFLQELYNKRKPKESDKADYNATGLDNAEMLTDIRVIYILTISFPKTTVDKNANNVQCYVGKATHGIRNRWHCQPKSHLRNARDVLQYFTGDDPSCPHMSSPPPLVDCTLVHARLMGYDTSLYIVDQLCVPSVRPPSVKSDKHWNKILDAELDKKKSDWVKAIKASNMLYGLNTRNVQQVET